MATHIAAKLTREPRDYQILILMKLYIHIEMFYIKIL